MNDKHQYHLKTGKQGEEQLDHLDKLLGGASRNFLQQLGLQQGMQVLDVGCGIGNLSCWLAEQVGEQGCVVAIDKDPKQLDIAKQRAQAKGLSNIVFHEKDAEDLSEFNNQFDLTYCRSLLIHVKGPAAVVRSMAATVNQNGLLACEVSGDHTSTFYYPSFPEYNFLWQKLTTLLEKVGNDINIGFNIFKICKQLDGFSFDFNISQPVLAKVNEIKSYGNTMGILLDSMSESLINNQVMQEHEVKALKAKLKSHPVDEGTVVFLLRMTQVWCRRLSI